MLPMSFKWFFSYLPKSNNAIVFLLWWKHWKVFSLERILLPKIWRSRSIVTAAVNSYWKQMKYDGPAHCEIDKDISLRRIWCELLKNEISDGFPRVVVGPTFTCYYANMTDMGIYILSMYTDVVNILKSSVRKPFRVICLISWNFKILT